MILKQDPSTSAMILQSYSSNLYRFSVLDTKILTHILSSPKSPNLSTELQLSFYRPLKQRRSRGISLRARSASRTRSLTFPVQNIRAIFAPLRADFAPGSLARIFQRVFAFSVSSLRARELFFACANFPERFLPIQASRLRAREPVLRLREFQP
jgi:hypothetical protein